MLEDLLTSAKQTLLDRLASPLIGSFVVAWPLWNWKFIVILLSNNTVTTTFELIDKIAFPTTSAAILKGVLYPLLSALAYVFVYPYPARFVYSVVRRHQADLNRRKQEIEGDELLTKEESRFLRAEIRQQTADYKKLIDQLMSENEELKRARPQSIETHRVINDFPDHVREDGSEKTAHEIFMDSEVAGAEAEVLSLFGRTDSESPAEGGVSVAAIRNFTGKSKLEAQYLLDRLIERKLIKSIGPFGYALTPKGRRYLIEKMTAATERAS